MNNLGWIRGPSKGGAHAYQGLEEQANERVRLLARPTRTASTRHEGSGNLRCTAQLQAAVRTGRAWRSVAQFRCTPRVCHRVFITIPAADHAGCGAPSHWQVGYAMAAITLDFPMNFPKCAANWMKLHLPGTMVLHNLTMV